MHFFNQVQDFNEFFLSKSSAILMQAFHSIIFTKIQITISDIFGKVEQGENGSEIKHEGKKSIKLFPLHFTLRYIYLFHYYSFLVDLTVEIDEQNEIGSPRNLEGSH